MRLAFIFLCVAGALPAADFRYGFAGARQDNVELRFLKPPITPLAARSVALEVGAAHRIASVGVSNQALPVAPTPSPAAPVYDPNAGQSIFGQQQPAAQILSSFPAADLDAIRAASEKLLTDAGLKLVTQSAEATIRVTVSGFDPVRTQQTSSMLTVNARDPNTGQAVQQQIAVDVWEGVGRLSLRIEVIEAATGRVLDGFATSDSYLKRGQIGVNGQRTVEPAQLPLAEQIWAGMLQAVTTPIAARYGGTLELVKFPLAVEEELRAASVETLRLFSEELTAEGAAWAPDAVATYRNRPDIRFLIAGVQGRR